MLWMAIWLHALASDIDPAKDAGPRAVVDRRGARRIVIAHNYPAAECDIEVGMDAAAAKLRQPELQLVQRTEAQERRAVRDLADWALQFSSDVIFDYHRWLLWIELGASVRYFDGLDALRQSIAQSFAQFHYSAHMGVAPTLEAAALFAQTARIDPLYGRAEIAAAVSSLPLIHLPLSERSLNDLRASGLVTLGDVLAIPFSALSRRFGAPLPDYLRRLLGTAPDIRRRHRAAQTYRRRSEFLEPIQSIEALLFPLRRLIHELTSYLRVRDAAIHSLETRLGHHDGPDTVLRLQTTAPKRDAQTLFTLLRERLERTPWAQTVTQIRLLVPELHSPEITQSDLFDDSSRRTAGWKALLDKMRARIGTEAVRCLGLRDSHLPEHAWCAQQEPQGLHSEMPYPERPLWLLEPVHVTRPAQLPGPPERIESGWWDEADESRDYFVVDSPEGSRLWLYRDATTQEWFLQGIWA